MLGHQPKRYMLHCNAVFDVHATVKHVFIPRRVVGVESRMRKLKPWTVMKQPAVSGALIGWSKVDTAESNVKCLISVPISCATVTAMRGICKVAPSGTCHMCMRTRTRALTYAHTRADGHAGRQVGSCPGTWAGRWTDKRMGICPCGYAYVHMCAHTCTHAQTYEPAHMCACMSTCTCVQTYTEEGG